MAKKFVSNNSVSSAFKLAVLLTLVLGTIWFIYNYLQTGSFSLRPSAKGGDCTKSSQCGSGYLCKAGVCVKNESTFVSCCTARQRNNRYKCIGGKCVAPATSECTADYECTSRTDGKNSCNISTHLCINCSYTETGSIAVDGPSYLCSLDKPGYKCLTTSKHKVIKLNDTTNSCLSCGLLNYGSGPNCIGPVASESHGTCISDTNCT